MECPFTRFITSPINILMQLSNVSKLSCLLFSNISFHSKLSQILINYDKQTIFNVLQQDLTRGAPQYEHPVLVAMATYWAPDLLDS